MSSPIKYGVLSAIFMFYACSSLPAGASGGDLRNIILCIADGMGYEHVKAGRYYLGTNLVFETFPYQSSITTAAADQAETDSGASATAMATGTTVNKYVISVELPGSGEDLETLLEYYKARGKSTGLVTTDNMTDATPAAFGAHTDLRDNTSEIISDYFNQTRPNVLLGGGGDGITIEAATNAGYTVVTDLAALQALNADSETYVSGQFGFDALPFHTAGLGSLPDLHQMASAALDLLDHDPDGFFLMVEEERMDSAGHENDIHNTALAAVEFSKTIDEIVQWMAGRQDTLLIVTADHETGGLTVTDEGVGNIPTADWESTSHTDQAVPVYAYGINAHLVTNVLDNTDINTLAKSTALIPQILTDFSTSGPELALEWTSTSSSVYRLEHSGSLLSNQWNTAAVQTASSHRISFSLPASPSNTFFRLITE